MLYFFSIEPIAPALPSINPTSSATPKILQEGYSLHARVNFVGGAVAVEPPLVVLGLIVKFNVAVFTQPDELSDVKVYTPLAVYVKPFAPQVYESQEVSVKVDDEPLFVF